MWVWLIMLVSHGSRYVGVVYNACYTCTVTCNVDAVIHHRGAGATPRAQKRGNHRPLVETWDITGEEEIHVQWNPS